MYHSLTMYHSLIVLISLISAQPYCWDESERFVLQFTNNANKNITHLPTVRLIQGYYPSQFAMQYAAYVYLREKMGVDVTFFPSNDANSLFDRYDGYTEWCDDINANQSTCSPLAPYPQFYFEEIKNDEYDLLFEIWDIMLRDGKGFDYIDNDLVTHGGISGVYGEGGWFVPKYVYDEHPEWILPHQLKHNESLRQIFIDAYTAQSEHDYIDRWWRGWGSGSNLDQYSKLGFGTPNYSKPVVFGSYEGYAISKYSAQLVDNLLGGIDWTFAAFGSEGNLTAFVIDLYSKGLPFIANLYSPHRDFATTLANATEYMQFERIALPRNPNNDVDDVCYEEGRCSFPLSPLLKIANPKLLSQFHELSTFVLDFQMSTNDVNDVIAYYTETSASLTAHERWVNATCKWLKESESTTNGWHQDIVRFDCIFEDDANCGFNYYYATLDDAVQQSNAIRLEWYESIAGSCSNDTHSALCACPNEYFVGETCRVSCPGMIGPILETQSIDNESQIVIGDFVFYICSGHGTCDLHHKSCECVDGFGGDSCDVAFQIFELNPGFIVLWSILFGVLIVVLIASGVWTHSNKHYKSIRRFSPNMTLLFTLGLILLCIGSVMYLFHPLNDALCNARVFCGGIGAILTIMGPLCKTYRVALIFTSAIKMQRVVLKDKQLVLYIGYGVLIECVICCAYTVFHQLNGGVDTIYLTQYERVEYKCNQSDAAAYVNGANLLYIFTLVVLLWVFSRRARNAVNKSTLAVKGFKDTQCAYLGSLSTLVLFVVLVIWNFAVDDIELIILFQSGVIFVVLCIIWALFYAPKMYQFFKYPEKRDTTTNDTSTSLSPKTKTSTTRGAAQYSAGNSNRKRSQDTNSVQMSSQPPTQNRVPTTSLDQAET
eukprot:648872_1